LQLRGVGRLDQVVLETGQAAVHTTMIRAAAFPAGLLLIGLGVYMLPRGG
jgi:hypothetical protein